MLFIKSLGRLAFFNKTTVDATSKNFLSKITIIKSQSDILKFSSSSKHNSNNVGPQQQQQIKQNSTDSAPSQSQTVTAKATASPAAPTDSKLKSEFELDSASASVASVAPATPIKILDSCLNRLREILDKPSEQSLRIHVETGGCSGFSYIFEIEQNPSIDTTEDLIVERENYRIVLNKEILPYIKGSKIGYEESLIKSSFQIVNPLAETKCSCGSSFSIDFNKLQKQ